MRPLVACLAVGTLLLTSPAWARPPRDASRPPRLRACCALGYDLDLRFGDLDAPVGVQNVVTVQDLGRHRYADRTVFDERNGLLYTCRAGFIDVGHVRGAADLVAHVHARLLAHGDEPGQLRLQLEDGPVEVELTQPIRSAAERRTIAQRVAYDATVWHEIVTGIGGRTVPIFSERFSAFSPEDLYSDLLGTHLGAAALASELDYDHAMDVLLTGALRALDARPLGETRAALDQVEGEWWRRAVAVPERELLARRNFDIGPELRPWQIPEPEALSCPAEPPRIGRVPDAPAHLVWFEAAAGVQDSLRHRAPEVLRARYGRDDFADLVRVAAAALTAVEPVRRPPAAAIQIMSFRGFGGVGLSAPRSGGGGLEVVGGQAQGPGGDLSIIRFTTLYDTVERGLVAHFTGIQARQLFFCRERGTGRSHPPIAAWFQSCAPNGFFGVGGTLAQAQYEGATGRWALRPVEAHLAFALLANAFAPDFLRHHWVLETGVSVETAKRPDADANFSVRGRLGLRGQWRSDGDRWAATLRANLLQDATDTDDRAFEAGLDLAHHLPLTDAPRPGETEGPVWAVATLGTQFAYSYWRQPDGALDDQLLPLTRSDRRHSARALLTVGLRFRRWVF